MQHFCKSNLASLNKVNLFSFFCNLIKKEIEKDFGPRTSEKVTESLLKEEYDRLRQSVKITLNSGKVYIPKIWVNRPKEDLEKITDEIKIYIGQRKNEIFKRISIADIVSKSKDKEIKLKGFNEEDPIDLPKPVVKKITNLYNELQGKNIYPKRSMQDTPLKAGLGNEILEYLKFKDSQESSAEEETSDDEKQVSSNSAIGSMKKEFDLCFCVPFSNEEAINLINQKYAECKSKKDINSLDELISDIQKDVLMLKEHIETLQLLEEGIKIMKDKLQTDIKEELEKKKQQQLETLKANLGDEIAEKFKNKLKNQ